MRESHTENREQNKAKELIGKYANALITSPIDCAWGSYLLVLKCENRRMREGVKKSH